MTTVFLWIFLSVIAILLLLVVIVLFFCKVKIVVTGNNDVIARLAIYLLGFKILAVGVREPEDEVKIKVAAYSPRALDRQRKRLLRQRKKAGKQVQHAPQDDEEQPGLLYTLKVILNILRILYERFAHHLTVRVVRMKISVAAGDAAKTATLYGAVIQSAAYIIELLDNITKLRPLRVSNADIHPDFCGNSTQVDIRIVLRLRVWRVLSLLFMAGIRSVDDINKLK